MDQNQSLQIFYEIAMSIGASFDLRKMLKISLLAYLKRLNCAAGWVYCLNHKDDGTLAFEIVHSIPRNVARNEAYAAVEKAIPNAPSQAQLTKLYKNLPLSGQTESGNYYYMFELPDFGLMVLVKNDEPLEPTILKSLKPLQARLAAACIACANEAAIQTSLERRTQQVQISANIAQEIAAAPQLDELFQKIVSLVQEEFDYYYAHLYTLEKLTASDRDNGQRSGSYLVMQQGTGEAAEKMKAAGHKIALATEKSLVARAARSGEPVLVSDVSKAADWLPNPLLPDTKAELAVPIKLADEILGVLDVQNNAVGSLNEEDKLLLQGLCGQIAVSITNQRTKQALQQSEMLLGNLIDNTPDVIYIKQPDGRYLRINKQYEELFNVTNEQVAGKTDYDIFPKELADVFRANDVAVLEAGKLVELEEYAPHPDGLHTYISRKFPLLNSSGKVYAIAGISTDVTQIKKTEEKIREDEILYQSLLNAIPQNLYRIDREGQIVFGNKSYLNLMGMSLDELRSKTPYDLAPKDVADQFIIDDRRVMQTGEVLDTIEEFEPVPPNTEKTYSHVIKTPVRNIQGNIIGLQGIFWDVTEERRTELERESLLADVQRLAAIVENHPDFIGVGTMDGKALYVNPAGLKMMDLPSDHDVTPMNATDFYSESDATILTEEAIPTAMAEGSWSAELNLLKANGVAIPVEATIGINYNPQGEAVSFSITMRDITERKETDAERERLMAQVESAYRQYVQQEWEQYLGERHQGQWRIEYGPDIEQHSNDSKEQSKIQNPKSKIESPIAIRGQSIGTFSLEDLDPDRRWTEEEKALVEAVSEQLALTIENLRLFENTQQRAGRERLTRQITTKMRAAPDVDSIIQTGLAELSKALDVSRTYVKLTPVTSTSSVRSLSEAEGPELEEREPRQ